MTIISKIDSDLVVSISDFKKHANEVLEALNDNDRILVLTRNKPAFYLISVDSYEKMMKILENHDS